MHPGVNWARPAALEDARSTADGSRYSCRRCAFRAIGADPLSRDHSGVKVEPTRQTLLERVRVQFHENVIGMTCLECEAVEVLRTDPSEFDDEVRRFLRTHPSACHDGEAARQLRAVPAPR